MSNEPFHYPRPTTPHPPWTSIQPRPLHSLTPPPSNPTAVHFTSHQSKYLNHLQTHIRPSPFEEYDLSTHVFPAAYPRLQGSVIPHAKPLTNSDGSESRGVNDYKPVDPATWSFETDKQKRKQLIEQASIELVRKRMYTTPAIYGENKEEEHLWVVWNRYKLKNKKGSASRGLTMVLLHANGFHKEIWEETLKGMIKKFSETNGGNLVEEIWCLDSVNHGDSGVLNDEYLGDVFSWADNARDVLTFLLYGLPDLSSQETLPFFIPTRTLNEANKRQNEGFADRLILSVGHSLGGGSITRAAIEYPNLFSNIILVDPIITPHIHTQRINDKALPPTTIAALGRRTVWGSREEAYTSFKKNPFFAEWDDEVLRSYIQHGLIELEDGSGSVRLKISGFQEGVVFSERRVPLEVWELLGQGLPERIGLRWIMSGTLNHYQGGDESLPHLVWRRPANSSNIRVKGVGHLVPQVAPETLGEEFVNFIEEKYGSNSGEQKPRL